MIDTMKKLLIFTLAGIAFFLCSCDNDEIYYQEWEGEYVAAKSVEVIFDDGTIETYTRPRELPEIPELPIYIFRDKGLYVQTYGTGVPYIPGVDPEEHILRLRSPRRTSNATNDSIEIVEEGGIELEEDTVPHVFLLGENVCTYYKNGVYSPKPIPVLRASSDKLILTNSPSFEVFCFDGAGQIHDTLICHWEYSPIQKLNAVYTWDAELHAKSINTPANQQIPVLIRKHYVFTRK